MRSRRLLCGIALVAVTACSGSDASDAATTDPPAPAASADGAATTAVATGESEVPTTDAAPVTEPAPTTSEQPADAFFGDFDTVIALATDESGGGIRPLLEWAAVPSADHYGVYLYAPNGATYWAWRGAETSVFVGGATQIRVDAPGPSVAEGMTWAVIAFDTDLLPVGASAIRPIAP